MSNTADFVRDRLLLDEEEIVKENIDRLDGWININDSGEVLLRKDTSNLNSKDLVKLYLVGAWFANKGEMRDTARVTKKELNSRLGKSDRSIRRALSDIEENDMVKSEDSETSIRAEFVESILDDIEQQI